MENQATAINTPSPAHELADEIVKRRKVDLGSRITRYKRKNTILSDIGDCERQMTYAVLDWEKRPLHDENLQARFDVGNLWEREVIRTLQGMGFDFIMSQSPVTITGRDGESVGEGRIDGFIRWSGTRVPVEIKSMDPNLFRQVNSLDDFRKKPWLRKYLRQLTLYCFGHNYEWGIFIVVDGMGHWKLFVLALDYGEAEQILQRLERVHEHIKAKTYAPRIPYDAAVCGKCPFAAICLQDVINKEALLVDNPELENTLDRHEELKPMAVEYDDLHEKIKTTFKGVEKVIVGGRYLVQSVPSARMTYEVPDDVESQISEMKKAFAVKKPVERLVIQKLDKGDSKKTNE